jgi:MFS family permease
MITFATLCAAYILSQFYRSFLAIVAPNLTRELGLGPAELGALSAAWFGAFALAQFPIGWALDRLGPRRTLGGAMLGAVAGALLFAAANGFPAMMAAMALIGIGCAPVLMASMFVFGRAYPPERFALLSSLVLGIGALGVLAAATPLAYAVEAFGWRASIMAIGALTAAATVAVFLLIKDPPLAPRAAHIKASAWRDLVSIMTLKALWPLLPLTFVAYAVVAAERSLWIGPYLLEVHALDAIARGNAILAMSVAMSIGAIAYGPAERLLRSAKLTVLIGSVVRRRRLRGARRCAGALDRRRRRAALDHRQLRDDLRHPDDACPRLLPGASPRPRHHLHELHLHRRRRSHPGRLGPLREGVRGKRDTAGRRLRPPASRLRRAAARRDRDLRRSPREAVPRPGVKGRALAQARQRARADAITTPGSVGSRTRATIAAVPPRVHSPARSAAAVSATARPGHSTP